MYICVKRDAEARALAACQVNPLAARVMTADTNAAGRGEEAKSDVPRFGARRRLINEGQPQKEKRETPLKRWNRRENSMSPSVFICFF